MTTDDEIKRLLDQADALKAIAAAEAALETATAAYRADMSEDNQAAYMAANVALADARAAARADRPAMGVAGDAIAAEGSEG